ncbi:MAG: DUF814 domain-containing protein [Spirochaetaceae bacterium]|nr:MAG: DUF814 domain-containing protein [Spirochaetaceae bacterium]
MSLNWKEIDAVLAELPLTDAFVRKVVQPDYRNLVLTCYQRSRTFHLLICLEPQNCRMHRISSSAPRTARMQRFMQILRSRLQGGRIIDVEHVNRDRIVRLTLRQGGEICLLWIRLWGTAANVILTDETGLIHDAFFRRPARGELSGARYQPTPPARPPDNGFAVRDLPGEGDFNSRLEHWYGQRERQQRLERARDRLGRQLVQQQQRLEQRLAGLHDRFTTVESGERWQLFGDLITSNLHLIEPNTEWVTVDDYTRPGNRITIQLDAALSPAENAQRYYRRQKKARSGRRHLQEEIRNVERQLKHTRTQLQSLQHEQDPLRLEQQLTQPRAGRKTADQALPGLTFESHGFQILVGRSARENDLLLRRYARGNDTWLHARDYPGGYVFVRQKPGKSIPLEVLLDAATLALAYSKGGSDGDVYYTRVKHLRRARHGKTGTVIPTQESNLSVRLDRDRLRRLKDGVEEQSSGAQ